MLIVDLANEIYQENAEPKDTGIPAISFWIRSNVGKLNLLLYENFCVDFKEQTYEIKGLNNLAAEIIKLMYSAYRVDLDIRNTIRGIGMDAVLSASDQEFKITKINKSEVLKTLTQFKKDTLAELQMMVHYYRSYGGTVSAVSGDDFIRGRFFGTAEQYIRDDFNGI